MASALQGFRFTARSCACAPLSRRCAAQSIARRRAFATTTLRLQTQRSPEQKDVLKKIEKAVGYNLDEELAADKKELQNLLDAEIEFGPVGPDLWKRRQKLKETFLNMGDPEPFEDGDFDEDGHDDLPSLAHGELEQHREWRHYARLAAWEMPLLSKLAKPFEPPTGDMSLRFRYTTYLGESHPAEKKVVVEFSPADMPNLTSIQREKLKKLAGTRYNPEEDIVRMSCEMYETQAQNKRYLGDLIDTLLKEARDPTDTFADVPLDIRHHHFKPKLRFPQEWALTDERREQLAQYRLQMEQKDQKLELEGQLVDGLKQIEQVISRPIAEVALPEMVLAGGKVAGGKAKGKKVAVRR
ncbi:37S ribosomal protein S24, mitochondrial [Lachnellula subtilissima]|uniref:37S ribosomal protein S24, mitochondrial n=1 Tax=Lachnellula subtilissima TaxID=602034 RepID=A0A8H8U4X6_9HELO|nr:37S ribosomal protein S24, mitochondrial [Lachnellula subtilissima]